MPGSDENVILVESDDDDETLGEKDDGDVVFVDMTPIPLRPARIKSDAFLTPISIDSDTEEEDIIFVSATNGKHKSGRRLSPDDNDVITITPLESVGGGGVGGGGGTSSPVVPSPTPPTLDTVVSAGANDLNPTSALLETPKLPPGQPSFHDDTLSFEDATSTTLSSALSGTSLQPGTDSRSPDSSNTRDNNKSPVQSPLTTFLSGSKSNTTNDCDSSGSGAGRVWSEVSHPGSHPGLLAWLSDNTSCYAHQTALSLTDTSTTDLQSELTTLTSPNTTTSTPVSTSSSLTTSASVSDITSSFTNTIAQLLSAPPSSLTSPLSPPPSSSSTSSPLSSSSPSSSSLLSSPTTSSSASSSFTYPVTPPMGTSSLTPSSSSHVDPLAASTACSSTSLTDDSVVNTASPSQTSQSTTAVQQQQQQQQQSPIVTSSLALTSKLTGINNIKTDSSQKSTVDGGRSPSQGPTSLGRLHDSGTAASSAKKLTPLLKRSSSYMQTHPNSIPLKKRRRQRPGGRLSLDSAEQSDKGHGSGSSSTPGTTANQKCSWCQLVVCFSDLSRCMQGHGCCAECLQHRAKTLLSKSKRGSLKCPYPGCDSYFAMSQLQRTLPRMVVEILEEKLDEEYINYAAELVWENLGESSATSGGLTDGSAAAAAEDEDDDDDDDDAVLGDSVSASHKEPSIGSLPVYWEPMDDSTTYKLVELPADNIEFTEIRCLFELTMKNQAQIQRILRIQNPILWQFYNVKKLQMEQEETAQPVCERRLCHGTSNSVVEAICKTNFDWRLCGAHGTMYGQGTYFARDASYSHVYTDNGRSRTVQNTPGHIMAMLKKSKYSRKNMCSRHFVPRTSRYQKMLGVTHYPGPAANANTATVNNNVATSAGAHIPNSQFMLQPPPAHFKPVMISPLNNATNQNLPANGSYPPAVGVSVVRTPAVYQNPIFGFSLPYLSITQKNSLLSQMMNFQMQNTVLPPPAHQRVPNNNNNNNTNNNNNPPATHQPAHTLLNGNEAAVPAKKPIHSMFIAKVLVGRFTNGHTQYRKPPPLDLSDPYGRAYDSCVDNMVDPKIYVIFDSAQCYPEYLIEYTSNSTSSI